MTEVALQDAFALTQLVYDHAWALDHGGGDDLAALYVAAGELTGLPALGLGDDLAGREAVRAWARRREAVDQRTRHVCTNVRLRAEGPGTAAGTVLVAVYRAAPAGDGPSAMPLVPVMVGDYVDRYVREDGAWRFAARRIVAAFVPAAE